MPFWIRYRFMYNEKLKSRKLILRLYLKKCFIKKIKKNKMSIFQHIYRTEECLEVHIINNERNQQKIKNIIQFYFKKLYKNKFNSRIKDEEEEKGIYRFPKFSDEMFNDSDKQIIIKCLYPIVELDEIKFKGELKSFQLKNATRLLVSLKKHLGLVYYSNSFSKAFVHESIDTILWIVNRLKQKTLIIFNDKDKYYNLWKFLITTRFTKKCLESSWIVLKKLSELKTKNKFFEEGFGRNIAVAPTDVGHTS